MLLLYQILSLQHSCLLERFQANPCGAGRIRHVANGCVPVFGIRALLACAYGELPLPPILAVYRDQLSDHSARIADFRNSRRIG